jgi:hypothetical protein
VATENQRIEEGTKLYFLQKSVAETQKLAFDFYLNIKKEKNS